MRLVDSNKELKCVCVCVYLFNAHHFQQGVNMQARIRQHKLVFVFFCRKTRVRRCLDHWTFCRESRGGGAAGRHTTLMSWSEWTPLVQHWSGWTPLVQVDHMGDQVCGSRQHFFEFPFQSRIVRWNQSDCIIKAIL